ncbi:MAG: hypothetical protein WC998_04825 [Candidatus Paceibacterota bacterium]|jgi:hypothetical protein
MEPEDLIKYVFSEERIDYELRFLKSRKRELVQARQRSIYLLHLFFPKMTWDSIAEPFGQKHDGSLHAYTQVTNYIATEKKYEQEMAKYITVIRGRISNKMKVNCTSVIYKMENKRAILRKTSLGYEITLKRLNHLSGFKSQIEQTTLNISSEALDGIFQAFKILNQ